MTSARRETKCSPPPSSSWAPWFVAHSEDKKRVRLNVISHLLEHVPYKKVPANKVTLPKRKIGRSKGAAYPFMGCSPDWGCRQKAVGREKRGSEPLLGSSDIQSLADLGNGFQVVREMRIVPIKRDDLLRLVGATLAPIVPLALTMMSLEELLKKLFGVLF